MASLIDYFEPKIERLGEASSRWLNIPAARQGPPLSCPSTDEGAPADRREQAASHPEKRPDSQQGGDALGKGAKGRTDPYQEVISQQLIYADDKILPNSEILLLSMYLSEAYLETLLLKNDKVKSS